MKTKSEERTIRKASIHPVTSSKTMKRMGIKQKLCPETGKAIYVKD